MPPFTVLHVCMGNICRSPMAERLLMLAVAEALDGGRGATPKLEDVVHSHSVGVGDWHIGEEMNPPAARQVRARGGDATGFGARKLRPEHIDAADLVLAATADQQRYVTTLRPDAASRTFVLGQFGRLLRLVDQDALRAPEPAAGRSPEPTPQDVYARGVALVAAVDAVRADTPPLDSDDLDDPWGRGDRTFARVADEIEHTLRPFTAALFPQAR